LAHNLLFVPNVGFHCFIETLFSIHLPLIHDTHIFLFRYFSTCSRDVSREL